jgi:hypothetical protein
MFSFKIVNCVNEFFGHNFTVEFYKDNNLIASVPSGKLYPYDSIFAWIQINMNILQGVQDADAAAKALIGAIDLSAAPAPNPVNQAISALEQLKSFKTNYIDTGLIPATDPTYVSLQQAIQVIIPDGSVVIPAATLTSVGVSVSQTTPPTPTPVQ